MTTVVETATRAQVMRDGAAAIADPKLMAMVEDFLLTCQRAREAWDLVHPGHNDGFGGLEDDAQRLDEQAEDAWFALENAWHFRGHVPEDVVEEVESAADEYRGRRRQHAGHDFAVVQSGPCDWSRGRAA